MALKVDSFTGAQALNFLDSAIEDGFDLIEEAGPCLMLKHEADATFMAIRVYGDDVTVCTFDEAGTDEFLGILISWLEPEDRDRLVALGRMVERYPAVKDGLEELILHGDGGRAR